MNSIFVSFRTHTPLILWGRHQVWKGVAAKLGRTAYHTATLIKNKRPLLEEILLQDASKCMYNNFGKRNPQIFFVFHSFL